MLRCASICELTSSERFGSEEQSQPKLNAAGNRRRPCDNPESRAVHILVSDRKCWMIQHVEECRLEFYCLRFSNVGFLGNAQIPVIKGGSAKGWTPEL